MIFRKNILNISTSYIDYLLLYLEDHPSAIFYDIETTGLSSASSAIYLIGAVTIENNNPVLYQWFDETGQNEEALLLAFSEFLTPYSYTIQYNGNRFDQPFLEAHFKEYGLPSPFKNKNSIDLFQIFKPLKSILKLNRTKQSDLEAFLGQTARCFSDGKDGIRLYKKYLQNKDTYILEELLGHNREDLSGIIEILSLNKYLSLFQGSFKIKETQLLEDQIIFRLTPDYPIPVAFSTGLEDYYVSASEENVSLSVKIYHKKIRNYYLNYKDYYFIPSEDSVVPKTLGKYMDKHLLVPASPLTCYTWIQCTDLLQSDPSKIYNFLISIFSFLLKNCK